MTVRISIKNGKRIIECPIVVEDWDDLLKNLYVNCTEKRSNCEGWAVQTMDTICIQLTGNEGDRYFEWTFTTENPLAMRDHINRLKSIGLLDGDRLQHEALIEYVEAENRVQQEKQRAVQKEWRRFWIPIFISIGMGLLSLGTSFATAYFTAKWTVQPSTQQGQTGILPTTAPATLTH